MVSCPKCSSGRIHGPAFGLGPYGGEHLRYTCAQCGYSATTPTDDAMQKQGALAKLQCLFPKSAV